MERLKRIALRFLPNAEQAWTFGLRLTLAGAAYAGSMILEWAWLAFFGKLFLMMAAWMLLSLWEKQFVSHLRRGLFLMWNLKFSNTSTAGSEK